MNQWNCGLHKVILVNVKYSIQSLFISHTYTILFANFVYFHIIMDQTICIGI